MPENNKDRISVKELNRAARIMMAAAEDAGYPDPHAFAEKYANMVPLFFGFEPIRRMADGDFCVIALVIKMAMIMEDPGVKEEMIEQYEDARAQAYAYAASMGMTHDDIKRMSADDSDPEDEDEDDDLEFME